MVGHQTAPAEKKKKNPCDIIAKVLLLRIINFFSDLLKTNQADIKVVTV